MNVRSTAHALPLVILTGVTLLGASCSSWLGGRPEDRSQGLATADEPEGASDAARREPEEGEPQVVARLYLMSKCPHCAAFVRAVVPVARRLAPHLRLVVSHVGGVVDGELASPHGEEEIIGDMIELCAQAHAPYESWLGFLECLHSEGRWENLPRGWQECGQSAGIHVDAVSRCVEGGEGAEMLASSFARAAAAGVETSPTLIVGDITVEGRRDADLLAQVLCAQFDEPLPDICEYVDPLPYVPVTFVTDTRCRERRCDVTGAVASLRSLIWGADVRFMTYQSEPGAALYRAARLKRLPAVVIGAELEDDREAFKLLRHLRRSGEYFVRTLGRFDPSLGNWVAPPEIGATMLVDRRCQLETCSTEAFEEALVEALKTVKLSRADYGDAEGRALYDRLRPAFEDRGLTLPAAVFGATLSDDEELFGQLERSLVSTDGEFVLVLGSWDPTAEICDNGADDDGDHRADCRDSDCRGQWVCRPLKRRRLELFAMSQCPFAAQVLEGLPTVVDHFRRQRAKLDLVVHYIGSVSDDGELEAMHGPAEVDENLRQVCAQHLFRDGYAFIDYLACRAASYLSDDWESCVRPPLEAEGIRRCAEGPQGQSLLRRSYERAEELDIGGSPTWLVNNRYDMSGRSASSIVAGFCKRNPQPDCDREVVRSEEPELGAGGCGDP